MVSTPGAAESGKDCWRRTLVGTQTESYTRIWFSVRRRALFPPVRSSMLMMQPRAHAHTQPRSWMGADTYAESLNGLGATLSLHPSCTQPQEQQSVYALTSPPPPHTETGKHTQTQVSDEIRLSADHTFLARVSSSTLFGSFRILYSRLVF